MIKFSSKMKKIIVRLAYKHGEDLAQQGTHFRLDMEHFDRLVVENIGLNRISVAHYFEQNGDLVADPQIVFWVNPTDDSWIPIGIKQIFGGDKTYAWLNESGTELVRYLPYWQNDLAQFAQMWAQNLIDQKWLERATKHAWSTNAAPEQTQVQEAKAAPRRDDTQAPDYATLIEWFEEGGCEATDGCWVEPDGHCEHGCPSWLLALHMV